jgi:hypothetical protein
LDIFQFPLNQHNANFAVNFEVAYIESAVEEANAWGAFVEALAILP